MPALPVASHVDQGKRDACFFFISVHACCSVPIVVVLGLVAIRPARALL